MKFDKDLFKAKLKEKRLSYEEVSKSIGLNRDTFSRRIGAEGKGFYICEIHGLMKCVPLSMEEVKQIFFKEED